ncbi:MAG: glucose 1-dehydrogenase [Candidatus Limnocylindrales bacterium]|jgi:NAD(P)-dependent dehydrogenase (short-subunit alcohol dehydrogenase family)
MASPFDLSGRVALVTGAGRGIGQEIARTLAGAGADIAILDLPGVAMDDTAAEVRATGRRVLPIFADVVDPERVEAAVKQATDGLGRIDILVNCAGIARNSPAESTTDDDWRQVVEVNLYGTYWCCRAVGRHMLERGSGAIVNIASMSGSIVNWPQPQVAYNASKAGIIQLTRSLASEWASRGVRVNCVSPGYIGTAMTQQGLRMNPDWGRIWLEGTPMGRLGTPADVANAVWYLASDAAAFATGSDLVVDGGYMVR